MDNILGNIIKLLNGTGRTFCDFSLNMFVQVSVLIIVLLVVDFLIRKRVRATFRYCIWMLVFVKLVLPPALSLPTGIGNFFGDYFVINSSDFERHPQNINPEPAIAAQTLNIETPGAIEYSPQQILQFRNFSESSTPKILFSTWRSFRGSRPPRQRPPGSARP